MAAAAARTPGAGSGQGFGTLYATAKNTMSSGVVLMSKDLSLVTLVPKRDRQYECATLASSRVYQSYQQNCYTRGVQAAALVPARAATPVQPRPRLLHCCRGSTAGEEGSAPVLFPQCCESV